MKFKIKTLITPHRVLASLALVVLLVLSLRVDFAFSQAVTQGYDSDAQLQRGMIVKIVEEDTTKVEPVTQATQDGTYGVVVHPNDAPATLSTDSQQVFVASTGKYELLVNDQNGSVNAGDYIVVSSISGIGMKVDEVQPIVVGRALESFESGGQSIGTAQVGDKTVNIGRVLADISVAGNPLQKPPAQQIPEALRRIAEDIANKPVSMTRLYIAIAVLIVSGVIAGSLLYSGIRSAITSIGRNPFEPKVNPARNVPSYPCRPVDFYCRYIWGIFNTKVISKNVLVGKL